MLFTKINDELLIARKENNTIIKDTLTMLKASIQNKQIEMQHDLSDDEIIKVIKSNAKQLNQTLDSAKASQRQELIEKTEAQLKLLSNYLPKMMSKNEIINELSNNTLFTKDMPFGKAMGLTMKTFGDKIDGNTAKEALKGFLS